MQRLVVALFTAKGLPGVENLTFGLRKSIEQGHLSVDIRLGTYVEVCEWNCAAVSGVFESEIVAHGQPVERGAIGGDSQQVVGDHVAVGHGSRQRAEGDDLARIDGFAKQRGKETELCRIGV